VRKEDVFGVDSHCYGEYGGDGGVEDARDDVAGVELVGSDPLPRADGCLAVWLSDKLFETMTWLTKAVKGPA
jgi:hypothetical protein